MTTPAAADGPARRRALGTPPPWPAAAPARGALVFDDSCRLCAAIASAIAARDVHGEIALVAASEALFVLTRFAVDPRAARKDVWFLVPGEPPVRGVAVLAPLAHRLPRWRRVAPALRFRPVALLVTGMWLLLKALRHEL